MTTIRVRQTPEGKVVTMSFLGHLWDLKTSSSPGKVWLLKHERAKTYVLLRHYRDNGRTMSEGDDSLIAAVAQAKFQILRLKYGKITPTFHEQSTHYYIPA